MAEPIFLANNDDPGMKQAVARARKSFRFFWREMTWEYRRIIPGLELAAVKAAFTDQEDLNTADDVEQMWVSDVTFDGTTIFGTLLNEPNLLETVAQGDDVAVNLAEITDWMYAMRGDVYGAFTVNHIRAGMNHGERRSHDDAWGLNFGNPSQIRYVPPEYIGQTKPGFLARLMGKGAESQDAAQVSSTEHPMAINMLESLEEFFHDKSNLQQTDEHGLNVLHCMSLGGAARGVSLLLKLGADPTVKTNKGLTAFVLAKRLGWKNVTGAFEKQGITS